VTRLVVRLLLRSPGRSAIRVLVAAMDGAIGVESAGIAGEGATFWVHLPAAPEQDEPEDD